MLCFSSLLSAQTFTDFADFADEISGTIIIDDFVGLTDGEAVEGGAANFGTQTRPWGTLGSSSDTFLGFNTTADGASGYDITIFDLDFSLPGSGDDTPASDPDFLIFTPDLADDQLEGFCFDYRGSPVITIFNGTEVVDTIQAPASPGPGPQADLTICWLNTDLEDVTRIEVTTPFLVQENFSLPTVISSASFAFENVSAPPVDTCRSLLEDLILDLGSIESTGNNFDDQLINCALWYLECATNDSLWSDDDHLASCNFFYYTNFATKYLSWVSDNAEVTQALEDIQAVLSCVTENEIAAATEAGGNANNLEWAEYYQQCADYFQAIGNYRKASRLRKYAFACAFQSY